MKLNLKLYSPFFIFLIVISAIRCDNKDALKNPNSATISKELYQGERFLIKADSLYKRTLLDSAFYYYNNAKTIFSSHNDSLRTSYALLNMGRIQRISGDYFGSETTITEALPYLKGPSSMDYLVEAYNILGMCYRKLSNYNDALYYYNEAVKLVDDDLDKARIENNKATVYIERGESLHAITLLNNILDLPTVVRDSATYARVLNNLGLAYSKIERPQAIQYLNESLSIRLKLNNSSDLMSSYLQLAKYNSSRDKTLSKEQSLNAYNIASTINNLDEQLIALQTLLDVTSGPDFKKYTETYIKLQDSVNKIRATAKNQFAKIKYDSRIVKEENLHLKEQEAKSKLLAERNRIQKIILIISLVFLSMIFYIIRLRLKKQKLKEVYDTERRLAKKIHDELANDIYNVMTSVEIESALSQKSKVALLDKLDSVYRRTRDISRENNDIDIGSGFPNHLREMIAGFSTQEIKIIISGLDIISWNQVSEDKKITAFRIIQELMINMKKHSKANLVALTFKNRKNKVELLYADNGVGFDKASVVSKGGLSNVENRKESINGSLTFDSVPGKGCKINFSFPI